MGKLIVIEGLDGSGKATQAELLYKFLSENGEYKAVRKVSFPDYDSPSSSLVKMYLAGEFGKRAEDVNAYAASSFYAVDRYASFKRDWENDWKRGIVIADRYTTSNAIHQCSKLPQSEWDNFIDWLFEYEYKLIGIPAPETTVYLSVAPEVSQRLLIERYSGEDKRDIHEKDIAYLEKCRAAAAYCAEKLGWRVVECCENGTMRSKESIQFDIRRVISE